MFELSVIVFKKPAAVFRRRGRIMDNTNLTLFFFFLLGL